MANKQFIEKLKAELDRKNQRPTRERWDELVARGAIDSEGKVLIRGPEVSTPSKGKAKPKGK